MKTYDPERSLDNEMSFRGMTGGFILTQILKSEPHVDPVIALRNE